MKNYLLIVTCLLFCFFSENNFGQSPAHKRASQNTISYENGFYRLLETERDPNLFVKSAFFRRDLPHWRKGVCRIDFGAVWYNGDWYLEQHLLFGRINKKVDYLAGLSFRSGNLPEEFLQDDALFLNPELIAVVRPKPFFGWLSIEARFNFASFNYYGPSVEYKKVAVPGVGLSIGYIFKKLPR